MSEFSEKRSRYAAEAMKSGWLKVSEPYDYEQIAQEAFKLADAMIQEEYKDSIKITVPLETLAPRSVSRPHSD